MAQSDGTTQESHQPRLHVNGPLAETQRMSEEELRERRAATESTGGPYAYGNPYGANAGNHQAGHDDEAYGDEEFGEGGLFEWVWEHWYVPVGLVALFLAAVVLAGNVFGGSENAPDASGAGPAPRQADGSGTQGGSPTTPFGAEGLTVRDTGVVFRQPVVKADGTYYEGAGEIAWKGEKEATDTGTEYTLEGPTAAQFKTSVALPNGSITTGVFGRAAPGKPMFHATFHRTTMGQEEVTTGTYYALDGSRVIVEGTYADTRDGDTVTRTYSEAAPGSESFNRYAVSFEAPAGALIPVLVGWKPPAEVDEDGGS